MWAMSLGDVLDGRAVMRFPGQDREQDFNLVEPGRVRRRLVEVHVLVTLRPRVAFGLVGGKIVEEDMNFGAPDQTGRE
jgi:hypothetical protein